MKTDATAAGVPALAALGGWSDAAWFCPTIMSDDAVAGFTFPRLPGTRKQSFHVIERATMSKTASRQAKSNAATLPRHLAGKLGHTLELFGASRAVACAQVRLLFETGPILFFAEFPASKLKQRTANKLRRALIGIDVRGCVLRLGHDLVIGMFWSAAETGITDFVNAAAPDHALHAEFEKPLATKARAKPASPPSGRAEKRASIRETRLLEEIVELRQQIDALKKGQSPLAAMEQLGLDDARLRSMLKLLHPDKHANSEEATAAAKWLNNLRDLLKGKSN